jgi:hypothetical protein
MTDKPDPAEGILRRLDTQDDVCGTEPPEEVADALGRIWTFGDCYCTLPPDHGEGVCFCEICTVRYGAPGWPTPKETL